jgi:hypothetical protein
VGSMVFLESVRTVRVSVLVGLSALVAALALVQARPAWATPLPASGLAAPITTGPPAGGTGVSGDVLSGAPVIESTAVSAIGERSATLEAQIDPEGEETTYEMWLEYSVCPNSGCAAMSAERAALGQLEAGESGQHVSATLDDLRPGEEYGYWVVASSPGGDVNRTYGLFLTLASPGIINEGGSDATDQGTSGSGAISQGATGSHAGSEGDTGSGGAPSSVPPSSAISSEAVLSSTTRHATSARAQEFARALKECKRERRKRRWESCEARARGRLHRARKARARHDQLG